MIKVTDITKPVTISDEAVKDENLSCNTGLIKRIIGDENLILVGIELTDGSKTIVGLHEVSN